MKPCPTISPTELEHVMGGVSTKKTAGTPNNEQLITTLQTIQSSIKDLGKSNNQGLFGNSDNAMLFTLVLAMQRRTEVSVSRSGYSWRSSW